MFTKSTMKKSLFLIVAMLMCLAVVFAACDSVKPFTPVEMPAKATVAEADNGGAAVKYGEWLYFINGTATGGSSDNSYADIVSREGAIARIKLSVIEELIEINNQDLNSTKKQEAIDAKIKENVQIVVPNYYYTNNTSSTSLNGLFIFNERIYITTPNDALDANGKVLSDQLVLTSYAMNGGDKIKHYTFTNNSTQIMLNEIGGKVIATFTASVAGESGSITTLSKLDVATGAISEIASEISNVNFDKEGKAVFFTDKDGAIVKYVAGENESKVLVENKIPEGKDKSPITLTIKSVNNGYVYYTQKDSNNPTPDEVVLYFANGTDKGVVSDYQPGSYIAWQDKVVYVKPVPSASKTLYTIAVASGNGSDDKELLQADQNDKSITLTRIEGNTLIYVIDNVSYKLDLTKALAAASKNEFEEAVPFAVSISTSASGGLMPKVIDIADSNDKYIITVSGTSVNVVKFDAANKKNYVNSSVNIMLPVPQVEADENK